MKNNNRFIMLGLGFAISAGAMGQAQACGEVMYRMGGALRYHAFITRHPAEILMYADAAQSKQPSYHEEFHRNLEKAGHKVTLIDSQDALARALTTHHYDVIIAYAASLPTINAELARAHTEPSLIPVFQNGGDETMRKQYPLALNENADLNQFLKTIEQTMKARGT